MSSCSLHAWSHISLKVAACCCMFANCLSINLPAATCRVDVNLKLWLRCVDDFERWLTAFWMEGRGGKQKNDCLVLMKPKVARRSKGGGGRWVWKKWKNVGLLLWVSVSWCPGEWKEDSVEGKTEIKDIYSYWYQLGIYNIIFASSLLV